MSQISKLLVLVKVIDKRPVKFGRNYMLLAASVVKFIFGFVHCRVRVGTAPAKAQFLANLLVQCCNEQTSQSCINY
jgi:hypothetical protein